MMIIKEHLQEQMEENHSIDICNAFVSIVTKFLSFHTYNKTPAQAFTLTCLKMRTYALWCNRQDSGSKRVRRIV